MHVFLTYKDFDKADYFALLFLSKDMLLNPSLKYLDHGNILSITQEW